MTTRGHTFRKDHAQDKINFIIRTTESVNLSDFNQKQKLYDIIDYYAEKNKDLRTIALIFNDIICCNIDFLTEHANNPEKIIELIDSKILTMKEIVNAEQEHSEEYHDMTHLQGIVNELQQIDSQSKNMRGNSISVAQINIVKANEDQQDIQLDSLDMFEMIDLGDDMDKDPSLITDMDLKENNNLVCIFCESHNILILSSTEGYCSDCNKNFLIQKRGDAKNSVLLEF